jgi:hypothetical protein
MKRILFLFLLLNSIDSFSQTIDSTDGYSMTEVVVSSMNNNVLYNKAKEWIALNFKSAKNVIQADIPNEKIIVKGISNYTINQEVNKRSFSSPFPINVIITFDFKDLKYKYKVETTELLNDTSEMAMTKWNDSIWNVTPGSGLVGNKMREKIKLNEKNTRIQKNSFIRTEISSTVSSIKNEMIKKKEDNW